MNISDVYFFNNHITNIKRAWIIVKIIFIIIIIIYERESLAPKDKSVIQIAQSWTICVSSLY